jgi:hypothetical protein
MWRSLFLAVGIFSLVLGLESLLIDRATVVTNRDSASQSISELIPPPWAPWSLMSAGSIVILYSFTLPKKFKGNA